MVARPARGRARADRCLQRCWRPSGGSRTRPSASRIGGGVVSFKFLLASRPEPLRSRVTGSRLRPVGPPYGAVCQAALVTAACRMVPGSVQPGQCYSRQSLVPLAANGPQVAPAVSVIRDGSQAVSRATLQFPESRQRSVPSSWICTLFRNL